MSLLNPAVLNVVTQGQNPSLTGNLANPLCRQARPKVAHSPEISERTMMRWEKEKKKLHLNTKKLNRD